MRIAFLGHWQGGRQTGPFHKVREQVAEWQRLGQTVGVFATTAAESVDDWQSIPADLSVVIASRNRLRSRTTTVEAIERWQPDLVYERHGLYYPARQRLARTHPVVVEINGNDLAEWRQLSRSKYLFDRMTRARTLDASSGMVFVSHELATDPLFIEWATSRPASVIGNGISLMDANTIGTPSGSTSHPRLLFVGHPRTPWHGVDHLRELAERRPEWRFDVVGCDVADLRGDPPGNITMHRELPREALRPFLSAADIGVGPLGLYRKSMNESSSLKVREYLAAGLPIILAGADTDIPLSAEYALSLPNTADGITTSVHLIDAFVEQWRGRRVDPRAIGHLDVRVKEVERLALMRQVLAMQTGRRPHLP